jgi:hypothetical protein
MNPKEPNSAVEVFLMVGGIEGAKPAITPKTDKDRNNIEDITLTDNTKICNEALLQLMAHLISEPGITRGSSGQSGQSDLREKKISSTLTLTQTLTLTLTLTLILTSL